MRSFAAMNAVISRVQQSLPGVTASIVIAAAATFLSEHYGAPVMLFALLLGLSMNFLSTHDRCRPGIEFAARDVLRVGVALLGLRITLGQIAALGWRPIALVVATVVITIVVSMAVARVIGFRRLFGLLTGGATAICGASAALALAAALPSHPHKERATLFTVIGVSTLSTLAMIIYPMIVDLLDLDAQAAGVFIGATIHDVAQVVGAGYGISQETGDTATVVKLMRIAMLLPVIVVAAMITRASTGGVASAQRPPLLPWFAAAFIALVAINSTGWIAPAVQEFGGDASRWCLVIAIGALGMKTELRQIVSVGFRPVALMIGETVFLAVLVLALLRWGF
jgi:uncharacterized integral membrane protein (TIGR00698 family)